MGGTQDDEGLIAVIGPERGVRLAISLPAAEGLTCGAAIAIHSSA